METKELDFGTELRLKLEAENKAIEAQIARSKQPKRSEMSVTDKTKFIAEKGQKAFLALPK